MEFRSYIRRASENSATTIIEQPESQPDRLGRKRRENAHIPPQTMVTVGKRQSITERIATHTMGNVSYSPKQLAAFYGFPNTTGIGTKIAVIELGGGYVQADLDKYFTGLGLTVKPVVFHGIDGAINSPGDPTGDDGEVMLDLCIAGAMAPGTELHCYMAPNSESGFLHAIEQAVSDKMTAISISWGAPEKLWSSTAIINYNAAFQRAADAGITVTAASGDSGSSDGVPGKNVDFPASSPLVLGCGGTSLPSLSTSSEVVWNDGGGIATGGGISALFAAPSYQENVNVPGGKFRGIPDVAGNADPSTGWKIIIDGKNYIVGGTSAVSPMWAALAACLTQAIGKNVGFLNAYLYTLSGWSRDVLVGNNGTYSARSGYDCCTGMGVPIGNKLLSILQNATPTTLPTPTSGQTPINIPTPTSPISTHTIVVTGTGVTIMVDGKSCL